MTVLRLILGDQLSQDIAALHDCDMAADIILMCEVWEEATYVRHHQKKIAFIFSAMRHFAQELKDKDYNVDYIQLDDEDNSGSFHGEIKRAIARHQPERIVVTFPGEYRVLEDMQGWEERFGVPVEIREDTRFLCHPEQFAQWAEQRKSLRMEYFYREMRKKYHVLMDGEKPEGGQWNYDAENRKPPKEGLNIPQPCSHKPDGITRDVMKLVEERFSDHFGDLEPFYFAVTRKQALAVLEQFINQRLTYFGTYQDAMIQGEAWMYHAHISFYLNCGLLNPLECIQAAEKAYRQENVPLNAVEGFIRQILGWREYVRGIYWMHMPDYAQANYFDATRAVPDFFWTANTQMNCLRQCISETKQHAYAHHIQRLMVLGNFALLAGLNPVEVNEWYLIVYADAVEWVEMPNVTGMVLFADGGLLASKPYAAGGNYIHKMSDYCKQCRYKVSKKNGPDACPFNYLYWDFLMRNRPKLNNNARLGMMYRTIDRMDKEKCEAIQDDARRFLKAMDDGKTV